MSDSVDVLVEDSLWQAFANFYLSLKEFIKSRRSPERTPVSLFVEEIMLEYRMEVKKVELPPYDG